MLHPHWLLYCTWGMGEGTLNYRAGKSRQYYLASPSLKCFSNRSTRQRHRSPVQRADSKKLVLKHSEPGPDQAMCALCLATMQHAAAKCRSSPATST